MKNEKILKLAKEVGLAAYPDEIIKFAELVQNQSVNAELLKAYERIAELVIRAANDRNDKDWTMMHLSIGEAAELARNIANAEKASQLEGTGLGGEHE